MEKQDSLNHQDIVQNMLDAGCNASETAYFCKCMCQGNKEDELVILEKRRDALMEDIHSIKDSIEDIDRAIREIRDGSA